MKTPGYHAIKKLVREKISKHPKDSILFVVTPSERYVAVNLAITDYLVNDKKLCGIYLTLNKPFNSISKMLKELKVNLSSLLFLDGASALIGIKPTDSNCLLLQSPSALTDMSIALSKATKGGNMKFFILDSFSAMLIYNNENSAVQFTHSVIGLLRKNSMTGIILALDKDMDKKFLGSVIQFCDGVIRIK